MSDDEYLKAVDREWRMRVIAYGQRGFRRLSQEDIDEAYNAALFRFWRRGHHRCGSVGGAGGLLCLIMKSVCCDLDKFYRAKRRGRRRSVQLGRVELLRGGRRRRVPLYEEVLDAGSVLGSATAATLHAMERAVGLVTLEGRILGEAAAMEGVSYNAMATRVHRLRGQLVGGLSSAGWRGPDGSMVVAHSKPRGRTRVAQMEFSRRESVKRAG